MDILKGEIKIYSINDDEVYEVDFMNLVVDKADGLKVVDCDNHFCEFTGVHPSKIKQGKLFLHNIIKPIYREEIMRALCKKNSPYVYFDAEFIDKDKNEIFIHCTGQNYDNSSLCRLTLADVSKSQELQEKLRNKAKEMNYLIDLVTGGVCLFKVTSDMHIEVQYLNEGACRIFGTTKQAYVKKNYRLDELIHPEDKSIVFQAIGKAMATDGECDLEIRTIVHKGEYKWCKFNAAIVPGSGDKKCRFGCIGYGSCVKACAFDAIHIIDGIAQVDQDKCKSCQKCMDVCPQHLIEMVPYEASSHVRCNSHDKGAIVNKNCKAGCI